MTPAALVARFAVLIALVAGACAVPAPKVSTLIPLGAGPEIHLGTAGGRVHRPAIAARGPYVVVAWIDAAADVVVAASRDSGATFSSPQVITTPAMRPNVTTSDESSLAVAMMAAGGESASAPPVAMVLWRSPAAPAGRLYAMRSIDGGRTFALLEGSGDVPQSVCGTPMLSSTDDGPLLAAWADCRWPLLALAALDAKGYWQVRGSTPVEMPHCSRAGVAAGLHDSVHLVWPWAQPDGVTDVMTAHSIDGGRSFPAPTRVSYEWSTPGCDDLSDGVAVDAQGTAHLAWAAHADQPEPFAHVFYESLEDIRQAPQRQQLDADPGTFPAHPKLLSDASEGVVVVWDEIVQGVRRVVLRQLIPAHHGPAQMLPVTVLSGPAAGSHPVLAKVAGGVIVAWTSGLGNDSTIAIRRVGLDAVCVTEAPVAGSQTRRTS